LKSKNNKIINNEIEKIYNKCFCHENKQIQKENKILRDKIEMIDKKYDILINENKNLKMLIETKTKNFKTINSKLDSFKKQISAMKNGDKVKTITSNQNNKKSDIDDLMRMGIYY